MLRSRILLATTVLAGLWPAQGWAADYLADAKHSMQTGDLRAALIQLRNAVKANPKNAEANYQLGALSLQLGDATAAEKDGLSAQNLGYDPVASATLVMKAYLAEGRYRDLLRDFPPSSGSPQLKAAVLVGRGEAQQGLNQLDDAQASFEEARRLAPGSAEPLLAEAQLAFAKRDVATAGQKIDAALQVAPNSAEALQRHAALLAQTGDQKGALAAADKAVAAAPDQFTYRLSRASMLLAYNQDAAAKADVDAVLASVPNNAQATYDRAMLLARAKDFKGANAELQKLSDYISRYPPAYLLLAVVKQNIGETEQAVDAASRYVSRNPSDPRGVMLLAELDLQAKQYSRAVDALSPLANGGTKDAGVYDLRGRALAAVGRVQESADDFQKGLLLSPDNPALLARLGATELTLGNAEFARIELAKSVQLAPNQPPTEVLLAEAELSSGRLDDAKASIATLQEKKLDPEGTANLAGLLKLANFDLPGARDAFEAILRDHPDSNAAQLNLARVDRLQGRDDESSALLTKVLQRDPTQDRAIDDLTSTLLRQKKTPEAIALLERAHAAAPANVKFTGKLAELYIQSGDPAKALALVDAPAAPEGGVAAPGQSDGSGTLKLPPPIAGLPMLLVRAQAQIAMKQTDKAAATYREILAANPQLTFARLQLIRIMVAANDLQGAAAVLQDGLQGQPQDVSLLQASVALEEKKSGLDAALAEADRLAKQSPAALPLKGDLYMQNKRYDDAAKAYDAAFKSSPSTLLVVREAGALSTAGHTDQAAQVLRTWHTQHPDDNEAAMVLADLDIASMQLGEAKTLLSAVVEKQPANVAALNNLAWVEQQSKDPQARALAERAYMLAPGPQTGDTLGYILATQGEGDDGVSLLRQASAEMPTNPSVQYHLAVALKTAGQPADAVKVLTPLVAAPGDFREKAEARQLLAELSQKP